MTDHAHLSRRRLLATGAGLGALTLAACGNEDVPRVSEVQPGGVLARLADVPVGGAYAVSLDGRRVLVTQPTAGTVAAFDARCTHQGCTVRPGQGELDCPCHGSVFDLATGAAVHGPATTPLAPLGVAIRGSDIVLT